MKSALFTGCRGKRAAGAGAGPAEPTLPGQDRPPGKLGWGLLGRAHLEGAVHQGLVQVDDHADLVRVLGLGLGKQVLDWGLLWGHLGLAEGASLKPQSLLLHKSALPQPSTWGATRMVTEATPPPSSAPARSAAGLSRPHFPTKGNQGGGKAPTEKRNSDFPWLGGTQRSWGAQGLAGRCRGGVSGGLHPPQYLPEPAGVSCKAPFPNPLRAEARCLRSPHLAATHLGDGSVLLHEQGRPTVGRQGLPVIAADAAEE